MGPQVRDSRRIYLTALRRPPPKTTVSHLNVTMLDDDSFHIRFNGSCQLTPTGTFPLPDDRDATGQSDDGGPPPGPLERSASAAGNKATIGAEFATPIAPEETVIRVNPMTENNERPKTWR